MPSFRTVRRVPFTPREMYAVVADVEHYPEFLPLCDRLEVVSRASEGERTVLVARMSIGYKKLSETLTTRVTLDPAASTILVEHLDGPMSRLENRWSFTPAPGGADVGFAIDYEFRSPMLAVLMGAAFDKAVRRYAEAFEERARAIHRGAPAPGA